MTQVKSNGIQSLDEFLQELHANREFEIFTAFEVKDKTKSKIKRYVMSIDDTDTGSDDTVYQQIKELNNTKRGIWFTVNSMFEGRRQIDFIQSFNAIGLDLDSGKEGNDRTAIENGKQVNLARLLSLQLIPTVIVETKNGLQPFWFLLPDEIEDNDEYKSLQQMMQKKLGADPAAIGGERLYRR